MTTIYNKNEYIFYMGLLYVDCGQEPSIDLRSFPLYVYDRSNCKFQKNDIGRQAKPRILYFITKNLI